MLNVLTPEEAQRVIESAFPPCPRAERAPLDAACSRVLFSPVISGEYVPAFDRSTVDGYAVRAADTFGCSDALPALLRLEGKVAMGAECGVSVSPGACVEIPTGGALPRGADAVVMLEYTEDYGDGTIGVCHPAAPGMNLIFRGDDVRPGQTVLPAGRRLMPQDIGVLAAMGVSTVEVCRPLTVGVISTGDELVRVEEEPGAGQVRDVNSAVLQALVERAGARALRFGIVRDDEALLQSTLDAALERCDMVLISGGSSVGEKDATERLLAEKGELLFHGIAIKPGKPTILARLGDKPVFGLPGHPAAAMLIARMFVLPLLSRLAGCDESEYALTATLTEPVAANHGRAQVVGVGLTERDGALYAAPIHGKSGLIAALAGSNGYFLIPRDKEGVARGETVRVYRY